MRTNQGTRPWILGQSVLAGSPSVAARATAALAAAFREDPVIPQGAKSFALLGQYVAIAEDTVFTVEYSVRGAMHGVYGLLGLTNEIPPIYRGITDAKLAIADLRTPLG